MPSFWYLEIWDYLGDGVLSGPCHHEEEAEQEMDPSQDINIEYISCHALVGIITPQTLKIEGYIKKKKVTILIDYVSTHNFINCKLSKILNYFMYTSPKFQVMIAYGGTINYSGKCHNIELTMGNY